MYRVSFIIVNFFTASFVLKLIKSIETFITTCEYEILIFDNSNDGRERSILDSIQHAHLKVFDSGENIGYVRANNYLALQAQHDVLVLLNPDTLLVDSSMERLFAHISAAGDIGAMGPMLLNEDNSYQISFFRFPSLHTVVLEHIFFQEGAYAYRTPIETSQDCDVVKGACLVVKRSALAGDSVFDNEFEMYSEEVDLCKRLKNAGLRTVYYPDARVIHYGERSSRQRQFTRYSVFHYYKSKLLYFRKHHSWILYSLIRCILFVSLLEKSIILLLAGRRFSSAIHAHVLKRLYLTLPSRGPAQGRKQE